MFPLLSDVSAAVYNAADVQTALITAPTNVLAVYFSLSGGRLVITAHAETTVDLYSVAHPWTCHQYFLSSAPLERWSASQDEGNFTLGHSQDVCLFHIADGLTRISGSYDTEASFDRLFYQYSGSSSTAQSYTGKGTIADFAQNFAVFRWFSDAGTLSSSFAITLTAQTLTLPYRRAVGFGTAPDPFLITDAMPPRSGTSSEKPSAEGEQKGLSGGAVAGIVIGAIVIIAGMTAGTVALVRFRPWKLRYTSMAPDELCYLDDE
jgi:hypothetical protein